MNKKELAKLDKMTSSNEEVKVWFFENGNKCCEIHFTNGKQDGLETKWYKDGTKKYETHYKNGKLDGLNTGWFEDGTKVGCECYKDGEEVEVGEDMELRELSINPKK